MHIAENGITSECTLTGFGLNWNDLEVKGSASLKLTGMLVLTGKTCTGKLLFSRTFSGVWPAM